MTYLISAASNVKQDSNIYPVVDGDAVLNQAIKASAVFYLQAVITVAARKKTRDPFEHIWMIEAKS